MVYGGKWVNSESSLCGFMQKAVYKASVAKFCLGREVTKPEQLCWEKRLDGATLIALAPFKLAFNWPQ